MSSPSVHRFCGVLGFFCPLISVALVFTQALYGAGNTMFVMVAEGILHFSCLIPMSWLAGITFGLGCGASGVR